MIDDINAEPDYGDEPPTACSSVFRAYDARWSCGITPGHAGVHRFQASGPTAKIDLAWSDADADPRDTGTAEPQAAKVIVVVEAPVGDRSPVERRYLAHEADDHRDYGFLRIRRDGRPVASYAQGAWLSAREDGALVPDVTLRKLSLAMQALQEIGATVLEADDKRRVPVRVARDALERIADVDL